MPVLLDCEGDMQGSKLEVQIADHAKGRIDAGAGL